VAGTARLIVVLAIAGTSTLVISAAAAPAPSKALTVQVVARDFSFALSRKSVPAGSTVRFVVSNRGSALHDFVVKGKRTRVLRPGQTQAIAVAFPRKGAFRFLCSVSGHARLGMKGVFGVSVRPRDADPPAKPPVDTSDLVALTPVGGSFDRPVFATSPPGDRERLFVVEQTGSVRIVQDGKLLSTPFLDLRQTVKVSSEPGLLSIAFAPDYATSGRLYAFYNSTAGNGDIHIAEFRRHPTDPNLADPYSERVVLTIVKPWENHNGGMLQFGPDGYLYASVGDGDSGVLNPPGFFAQRKDSLLGTILRIDPRTGDPYAVPVDNPFVRELGARGEIWAYGLRNPWRFWIDGPSGSLFVADAGNTRREEVNVARADQPGLNFGWPCFEGSLPFDTAVTCPGATGPALEYPRSDGACAVIGGVVLRDARIPDLVGRYLYGDYCSGKVTALTVDNGRVAATADLGLEVPELTSFGVDGSGRAHVLSLRGGVYRLDPRQ
jgi:glucose/arabinose dehydrogenase